LCNHYLISISERSITLIYWFKGSAVGKILGYVNINKALQSHVPKKYKKYYMELCNDKKMHGQTIFISESGLYRLTMKSKNTIAIQFQDWITDKVLPSLRQTGYYKLDNDIKNSIDILMDKYKNIKNENKSLKNMLENDKH